VWRDACEMHAAGSDFNEEEHREGLQAERFNGEEIARQEWVAVVI
jgi:hypothetical protein